MHESNPRGGRAAGVAAGLAFALATAVIASFLPALGNEFVDWDDDLNLTDNAAYRGFSPVHLRWMFTTMHGGHYQPLSWLTFALDHALWGMDPTGYHLTNVALHAANALVVYGLFVALLRAAAETRGAPLHVAAAFGAAFFALHPLRVESVAWASERRDVLSGLFYLLALFAYVRMSRAHAAARAWMLASLGCLALSLLAKAWGITFPLVLLILDAYPLRRLHTRARHVIVEKLPYAVLALAAAVPAFVAQRAVEEMRTLAEHGVTARIAQASYGLIFYLGKTVLPLHLSPAYLLEPALDPTAPRYALSVIAVGAVTGGLIALRRRWPWALAAWACYAVILAPVLGFAQTGPQLVADRYTYLACLPWALLLAAGWLRLREIRPQPGLERVGIGVATILVVALGVLTFRQTLRWRDSETLWTHVLAVDPRNYVAYTNRGWARTDPDAAIADYSAAIAVNPRYYLAHFNRGNALHARGDFAGAIADFTTAITLLPRDPKAYYNRGWSREARGEWADAAADYARALEMAPVGWRWAGLAREGLARAREHGGAGGH